MSVAVEIKAGPPRFGEVVQMEGAELEEAARAVLAELLPHPLGLHRETGAIVPLSKPGESMRWPQDEPLLQGLRSVLSIANVAPADFEELLLGYTMPNESPERTQRRRDYHQRNADRKGGWWWVCFNDEVSIGGRTPTEAALRAIVWGQPGSDAPNCDTPPRLPYAREVLEHGDHRWCSDMLGWAFDVDACRPRIPAHEYVVMSDDYHWNMTGTNAEYLRRQLDREPAGAHPMQPDGVGALDGVDVAIYRCGERSVLLPLCQARMVTGYRLYSEGVDLPCWAADAAGRRVAIIMPMNSDEAVGVER